MLPEVLKTELKAMSKAAGVPDGRETLAYFKRLARAVLALDAESAGGTQAVLRTQAEEIRELSAAVDVLRTAVDLLLKRLRSTLD